MDTSQDDCVTIVETRHFVTQAEQLLSAVEKDALFNLLGKDPSRGSSSDPPCIYTLEWGKRMPLLIDYAVSKSLDTIYMLAISEKDAGSGKPDKSMALKIIKKVGELSDVLANIAGAGESIPGFIESIKSIYDLIKNYFN